MGKGGGMKEKKIEKFIEFIRDNRVVCDSMMRCRGWEIAQQTGLFRYCIESDNLIKFCPYCGQKIEWDVEP